MISRRKMLSLAAAALGCTTLPVHAAIKPQNKIGFGFSLYGMKNLPLRDALQHCAAAGYDCVELPTMADWPGAPEKLTADDRRGFRTALSDNSLRLSALMENLLLLAAPEIHTKNLERLKAAAELGHDLNPTGRVIIETVMGGKPSEWMDVRTAMVDRLREWAQVATQTQTIIAIKAHISGAAHRPEHLRWLLDEVQSSSIKAAFDFSHFQLRDINMSEAWNTLAADTVFIHIKDSVGDQQKFQFVLPGEGTIDYDKYSELIRNSDYQGDVVVEVSGQIHSRPDYDPIATCKKSFAVASKFNKP